ncbi:GIY-YIG nuclease family protein [Belliella sp. DSM 111904]|uniref:GIY-YIG nuclease family protein n=1 Tax=Belliella filtrata TaxID=2923435 RepID=A0ABS9UWN6_9BACT|nr:exonuclease domain-containing protein [Belliella filtrata]MCH7408463.1 GIY-YIG nuclease family protein [Belliella filtrata]
MLDREFAIVDIETTGGNPGVGLGITEIAILVHNGKEVIDRYQTLINPERFIPGFITGLTGIDAKMVADAPTFEEVAPTIYELLNNRVFVAHNVNFDCTFIQKAFDRVGIVFKPEKICTVRQSRKIFPGMKSYSLGLLCEQLDIPIHSRHRAFGDAEATVLLFEKLLATAPDTIKSALKKNNGEAFLPPHISKQQYEELPEKTGIYFFHDVHGKIIYVGKALNIKSRFKGHFTGSTQGNAKHKLKQEIHKVTWKLTGSEMLAYLIEMQEIKKLWPKYNKSQKFISAGWHVIQYLDGAGYMRFQVAKGINLPSSIREFESNFEARKFLTEAVSTYNLCPKLASLQTPKGACYDYQINACKGACCNQETPSAYNERVEQFLNSIQEKADSIIIRDQGRSHSEKSAMLFEKGIFKGYCFIDNQEDINQQSDIIDRLELFTSHKETKFILRAFLPKIKMSDIIVLE